MTGKYLTLKKRRLIARLYGEEARVLDKQAHDHLLKGGIVQPEIKSARIRRGTDSIRLTEGDLGKIATTLTDRQARIEAWATLLPPSSSRPPCYPLNICLLY